ncbi:predicted protein [Arabidopsis lyrata subsp. lyrata]|uniref:Predicted protein n=1 Tax=Arabidopsis lyrata subsp. lyrata TaxID=81972 RepID=D7LHZ5_ARALL|nr:predicted protein [Arabidopsis lyrata subsp. lyrata]EFH58068.1 predicted protein [Arabidopsis lyrata subsp. lyrata]
MDGMNMSKRTIGHNVMDGMVINEHNLAETFVCKSIVCKATRSVSIWPTRLYANPQYK